MTFTEIQSFVDFTKLHNFAFLGRNPRIGCAADFLFAYVPFGPMKQLQMFFHAVDCCKKGLEKVSTAMRTIKLQLCVYNTF